MLYSVFWTKEIICGIWHICGQYLKLHKNAQTGIWPVWIICVSGVSKLFFSTIISSCILTKTDLLLSPLISNKICLASKWPTEQSAFALTAAKPRYVEKRSENEKYTPETDICSFKRLL